MSILVAVDTSDKDYKLSLRPNSDLYRNFIIKDYIRKAKIDDIYEALKFLSKKSDKIIIEDFIRKVNDDIFNGMLKFRYYEIFFVRKCLPFCRNVTVERIIL